MVSSEPIAGGIITVREADGRILVELSGYSQWSKSWLFTEFRRRFTRHHQAHWRTRDKCWSLPLGQKMALDEWLAGLPESVERRYR